MALPNFRQPVAGGQSGPIGGPREYIEYRFPYAEPKEYIVRLNQCLHLFCMMI